MKNHIHTLRLVAIASVIALPLSLLMQLSALKSAHLTGTVATVAPVNIRESARAYRSTIIQEAIRYTQVRAKCSERSMVDPTFVCPDFNDRDAIHTFLLSPETAEATHAAAASGSAALLTLNALSDDDQSRMTRFLNAGTCPESLKLYKNGFYDLCKKLLLTTTTRAERRGIPEMVAVQKKVRAMSEQRRLERLAKTKPVK